MTLSNREGYFFMREIVQVFVLIVKDNYYNKTNTYVFDNKDSVIAARESYDESPHYDVWIEGHEIKVRTTREHSHEYTGETIVKGW